MISKKVREFFVSLMEASDETAGTPVTYCKDSDQYQGVFNQSVVDKFIDQGLIELVSNEYGISVVLLNDREDFLSGFASGVNEARLGRDQYYADYNANPFAFSIGYEHFIQMNKKPKSLIGYVCHGFIDEATGEAHKQ